jgi:predicted GNAT family N-acyltransferase
MDSNKKIYLHAQLTAAPLYAKFGFKPKGENFWEAGIEHVKMVWQKD